MLFKTFLLFCVFVNCYAADEGDPCTYNKQLGICVIINKCITALREIKLRKTPQICGYANNTPVVCCLDELPTNSLAPLPPLPAIDSSSSNQPATPRPPSINVFTDTGQTPNGCAPVPAQLTAVKTGQKAFDKCIEYQEKYIYPCERGVTLTEDYYRGNYCHYDVDNLITSAWDTVKREFPHMAMLGAGSSLHNVNWFCSGTIVSERFILTAGQCQATAVEGPVKYAAVGLLSRQDLRDINNLYDVKRFIRHPNYSETLQPVAYMNDIALLEVETPIRLNQFVMPACLYSGDIDSSNVLATTWGHCGNEGQANDKIQKVNLQRIASDRCSRNYVFNTQKQECYASSQTGPNIGRADTGGSVIVKSRIHCMYLVIGVKSLKNSCDNTDPGVYTRVDPDLAWIESIVWP